MAIAQPGIFAQGTRAHFFLEFDLKAGTDPNRTLEALQSLRQPAVTAGGANIVLAFGPDLWRTIRPDDAPPELRAFPEIGGVARTQHDLFVWIHGTGPDVMLDIARAVHERVASVATLAAEVPGFVYHDSRDLTGFVDGTENPGVEEAFEVALVPDGPGAGGSFVITQRWRHDLTKFHSRPIPEQESVIGRTKPDSVELDDKPETAHISRVVIEENGEELEIYRRSVPYGTVSEHGLFFLAFSADPARFEKMLARMFGTSDDRLSDRLTEFTTPVTGSFYFAPSMEALENALG